MLNTTLLDTAEARLGAAYALEQHLHRQGASLCDLLDALDDPAGFSALCDLHGAFSQPFPDPESVETALGAIHRIPAGLALSALDHIGQARNLAASNMARWHGARVSELLARLHHAQ